MNIVSNIFNRIITTAHQAITNDDINNYNEDFSGMLSFKNPEDYQKFHEIGESIASILLQNKLGIFVMAYDTLAFCIRFHSNFTFHGINLRMISDSFQEIPNSTGEPTFLVGADDLAGGFGWRLAQPIQPEEDAEIFPVIDFKGICIYYALSKKHDSTRSTPQIFRSLPVQNSLSYANNTQIMNSNSQSKSESISQSFTEPLNLSQHHSLSVSASEYSSYASYKENSFPKNELNTEYDSQTDSHSVDNSIVSKLLNSHDSDDDYSIDQSCSILQNSQIQNQESQVQNQDSQVQNQNLMTQSQEFESHSNIDSNTNEISQSDDKSVNQNAKTKNKKNSIFDTSSASTSTSSSGSNSSSNSAKVSASNSSSIIDTVKHSSNLVVSKPSQQKCQSTEHANTILPKQNHITQLNLFDHSTSTSTSTSTSVFASSSTSNTASPSRKASPLKTLNTPPKRQKRQKTTSRRSKSPSISQIDKNKKDKMIQKKLSIQIGNFSKSTNLSSDKNPSREHKLKQQQLPVKIDHPAKSANKEHKSGSNSQKRLVQSKLPLVKDKKVKNNFSSDSFSEQSSNSLSNSSFASPQDPQKKKVIQKQHQSTLSLVPSKSNEKQ